MAENVFCKGQKANSEDFSSNYDGIFRRKDCCARIFIKKEDLSQATRDILYPEEKRVQEIDRRVKEAHKLVK